MSLYIQDSTFSGSYSVHQAICQASENAIEGAAVFAFATESGIELLFQSENIKEILRQGNFLLIVGIDAITNERAINKLLALKEEYPNLEVKAYYKNTGREIFHPKFLWFKSEDNTGSLLAGSGNLTLTGFRENVEAFTLNQLNVEEISSVEEKFLAWIAEASDYLKAIDDPTVIEKARRNVFQAIRTIRTTVPTATTETEDTQVYEVQEENIVINVDFEVEEWSFSPNNQVLIAEIPRSGSRWKQVNFSKSVFENFFGAQAHAENQEIILLRNINEEGVIQNIEMRPAVSVASDNYRFELNAATGIPYPDNGSPIGIFVKITPGAFIYLLIFPDDDIYADVLEFLETNAIVTRQGAKKRVISTCNQIEDILTNLPLEEFRI